MNVEKYNPLWLECNNLTKDFHSEQLEMVKTSINNAFYVSKVHCLHMYVTDMIVMEAILPALQPYAFKLSRPEKITGYRLLEVYK